MSTELATHVFVVALIAAALALSSAQTLQKPNLNNPEQNPESEISNSRNDQQQVKDAPKSPFTPPPDLMVKELTRPRTDPATTATLVVAGADSKAVQAREERQVTRPRSPFSPPPNREWRDQSKRSRPALTGGKKQVSADKSSSWVDSGEERQSDNADSIPPLADVVVADASPTAATRRRFKPRPKASGQRDSHEAEPGVTPWTRYTDKPRPKEEHSNSGKANARCGQHRYNPRNQICCQGNVAHRHGLSPACCQAEAYDTVFNKCCNGVISDRANGQSDC